MPAVVRELGGASADGDVAALQDLLESVPDGFDPAGKAGLGLWEGERLVAFADVLLGYPVPSTAYIGLLVVRGGEQGRGARAGDARSGRRSAAGGV